MYSIVRVTIVINCLNAPYLLHGEKKTHVVYVTHTVTLLLHVHTKLIMIIKHSAPPPLHQTRTLPHLSSVVSFLYNLSDSCI